MRNHMTHVGLGLICVALLAGLSYAVTLTMGTNAALDRPTTIVGHDPACRVCRLPLHGHDGGGSQLGRESDAATGPTALVR